MSKAKDTMKSAVVAFGGNALMGEDGNSTYAEQVVKTDIMCKKLLCLFNMGYRILITHGNGPQVGNFLMQQECLAANVPPMPLDACNAMTQGQIERYHRSMKTVIKLEHYYYPWELENAIAA